MEIKSNLFNKNIDDKLIGIKLSQEKITPFIKLIKINENYNVYIFLKGLVKKQIKIRYIDNFCIVNMNLKNLNTNTKKEFKRSFYLKNLDIDNIKIINSSNVIFLKIPVIN